MYLRVNPILRMKNLFFVAVATGIFSGTTKSVNAQTSVNVERLTHNGKAVSLKFIDGIEINPVANRTAYVVAVDNVKNNLTSADINNTSTNLSSFARIEKCSTLQFKYGMLMDLEVESITNFPLYTLIDEWWGTPYHYGGSTKDGIDCSAFTGQLFSSVYNTTLPRTASEQYNLCIKIDKDNLQEGDLVFFRNKRSVSHVGMYLGNDCFVHSSTNSGVTISKLTDDYYSRKFMGGGRIVK